MKSEYLIHIITEWLLLFFATFQKSYDGKFVTAKCSSINDRATLIFPQKG